MQQTRPLVFLFLLLSTLAFLLTDSHPVAPPTGRPHPVCGPAAQPAIASPYIISLLEVRERARERESIPLALALPLLV
jgi:hypothetical protein